MDEIDLVKECEEAVRHAKQTDDFPGRLKALELLVKVRLAGDRVKRDAEASSSQTKSIVSRTHAKING